MLLTSRGDAAVMVTTRAPASPWPQAATPLGGQVLHFDGKAWSLASTPPADVFAVGSAAIFHLRR